MAYIPPCYLQVCLAFGFESGVVIWLSGSVTNAGDGSSGGCVNRVCGCRRQSEGRSQGCGIWVSRGVGACFRVRCVGALVWSAVGIVSESEFFHSLAASAMLCVPAMFL